MQSNTLTRTGLFYLFLSVVLALLLHSEFLPAWVLAVAGIIMLWRYSIFSGKINKPSGLIKGCLVVGGFYGVYFTYGFALSIEAAVTLLVASLALKPLEVQTKSDSYVLLFLCILVQGQHFLFEQGPAGYLFVLLALFSTLSALVVVNQSSQASTQLKVASKIFLLSIPLTVFLFFILPRLGPLWSVNMSTKAGLVGLSESMSPGDISELGRSDELAFRVSFKDNIPPFNQRYWRALVLDAYDGQKWRASYQPETNWPTASIGTKSFDAGSSYDYEVTSEAHEKKWLFALEGSKPLQKDIAVQDNGLLINRFKAINKFQYKAEAPAFKQSPIMGLEGIQARFSYDGGSRLSALQRQAYLQLPEDLNHRTKDLADTLAYDSEGDLGFINALSKFYLSNPFFYTLSPGEAGNENRVDEFLFDTKIGFCAHYAGSAVYLLRSAGIPARVVLGYLGGEKNPLGDYYSVYQYDAHAWVEVWIKDRGWLRIDPTGWVSPERVEKGIEQAINEEFVGFRSQFKWLSNIRHQFQAFNYLWNDLMLSYKDDSQQAMLDSVFGSRDSLTWGLIISALMLGIMALVFLVVMMAGGSTKRSVHYRLLANYVYRLNKVGLDVNMSMSFIEIEAAVVLKYPHAAYGVSLITKHLNQALYAKPASDLDKQAKSKYKKLMLRVVKECR
jgi:transglutaminase-like putative cysteine protease